MKITIIRQDNFMSVDGVGYYFDLSQDLPTNFWALQWNGSSGEIEWLDSDTGARSHNEVISDIGQFSSLIDKWNSANDAYKAKQAAIEAANQLTEEQRVELDCVTNAQIRLDTFARTRNYDGVDSSAKYKDISDEEILALPDLEQPLVSKFRSECRYLSIVTAQTWARLYLILNDVKSGLRPLPSGYSEIENELPVLEWPV